jgi:hypothetical protein
MTGKHARREPGASTGELELHFPAHRRSDDEVTHQPEDGEIMPSGTDEMTRVDE